MPTIHKNCKENEFTALFGIQMESHYDRSHSFSKNTIIFKVFFTYKY